jgi:hypothetical protein
MNDDNNPTDDLNPIDPDDLPEVDEEDDGVVSPADPLPLSEEDDHESLDALADEEDEMDFEDEEADQM